MWIRNWGRTGGLEGSSLVFTQKDLARQQDQLRGQQSLEIGAWLMVMLNNWIQLFLKIYIFFHIYESINLFLFFLFFFCLSQFKLIFRSKTERALNNVIWKLLYFYKTWVPYYQHIFYSISWQIRDIVKRRKINIYFMLRLSTSYYLSLVVISLFFPRKYHILYGDREVNSSQPLSYFNTQHISFLPHHVRHSLNPTPNFFTTQQRWLVRYVYICSFKLKHRTKNENM